MCVTILVFVREYDVTCESKYELFPKRPLIPDAGEGKRKKERKKERERERENFLASNLILAGKCIFQVI